MIRLENIKRQFGTRVLFEGLSWMIPPGARLGLVGPNGAGKTTLLGILEGRDPPDEGKLHRPRGLQVGYLPQEVETIRQGSVLSVVLSGFTETVRLRQRLADAEQELASIGSDDPRAPKLTELYGELRHRFEHLEGDRAEARAKTVLSGLGVAESSFHSPLETLSGGWRMRVALARLLVGAPGLLLLDEPTNHLDLEAIAWLEEFLESYEGAFVVVSHDRYFLNRMVRGLVELDRGKLTEYRGNYDGYISAKQVRAQALEQQAKQQAREIKKVERFIERFRYKNTKARQVQSRIRSLDKLERVRTERAGRRVAFGFKPVPRAGDVVARVEGLIKRFGSKTVYDGLDLMLRRGDRLALAGPNGAGKSTMLKLLAGRLEPDGGRLELGHNVTTSYYAQHQLDDLDAAHTLLEEMEHAAPGRDRLELRRLLGCFLFTGDDVDKRIAVLSGGEKARLALAKLMIEPGNLLLLDEPTNHLDLQSREVLEEALNEYDGTLIVISHDRYFINRVATSVGEIGVEGLGTVPGDYDEFVEWKRRRALDRDDPLPDTDPAPRGDRREEKRREAAERNRRYRERRAVERRLQPVESEIAELEARLGELQRRQADPEVYRDPLRASEIGRDRAVVEARLEALYAEWETLARDQEEG